MKAPCIQRHYLYEHGSDIVSIKKVTDVASRCFRYAHYMDIVAMRLQNHHLAGNPVASAEEVARQTGAIQAQEYPAAKWALAKRLTNPTNAHLDELFNAGKLLRTHVMRPTWHFVLPEDIRWMLTLTAPRVSQAMSYYNRKLELDRVFFDRSNSIIGEALAGGNFLTRQELAKILISHGIKASTQRLGHIMMQAELDAVICSGPLKGKQFTYALLSERAPRAKRLSRDESIALLTERYFTSHGPATVQDFAWWSGLTIADARYGLHISKNLISEKINDKDYWLHQAAHPARHLPKLMLLSIYDEYLIAYKDYSPVFPPHAQHLTTLMGNAQLNYTVVKEGRVIGTFRRQAKPTEIQLTFKLLTPVTGADKALIEAEAKQHAAFFGLPLRMVILIS
jgi:hypothetical protein